jgi:hypothetical protein
VFVLFPGLLLKQTQAILVANNNGIRDVDAKEVYDSIFGIAFMGTPHRGSKHAALVDYAASLVKHTYIAGGANEKFVRALRDESDELEDLDRQFRNFHHLQFISVYETNATGRMKVSLHPINTCT